MTTHPSSCAEDGSVLRTATMALWLIVAGLAVLAWEPRSDTRAAHSHTVQHKP